MLKGTEEVLPLYYVLHEGGPLLGRAQTNCLQNLGILKPVGHSEWGNYDCCSTQKYKSVRICGDFKMTLNQCINVD